MSGRYVPSLTRDFSPLLRRLVHAAEAECPPGHAEALAVFIGMALRHPSGGMVDPRAASEFHAAIKAIARAQYEVDQALAAWRRTLASSVGASQTDPTSFYAGLAFGLVFAGPCSAPPTQR